MRSNAATSVDSTPPAKEKTQQVNDSAAEENESDMDVDDDHVDLVDLIDAATAQEENDSEDEDSDILQAVKDQQSIQSAATVLTRIEPETMLVENKSTETIHKRRSRKSKYGVDIAPGERKFPTPLFRDLNFDTKNMPNLHTKGRGGLHEPRKQTISEQAYAQQRMLNKDKRWAKCMPWLFMMHQVVERKQLESQISVSGLKGVHNPASNNVVNLADEFSFFQNLKGTPKYWQKTRNELIAKVEQLGPFHLFWTLSCGEMRWPEIFTSILQDMEISGKFQEPLDINFGNDEDLYEKEDDNITVNGIKLWDFVDKLNLNKHQMLKDEVVLIVRSFDARVRSFIKHVLMAQCEVPVQHYTFRVEFQARG